MNTKILMTGTSLILGLGGVVALFFPESLLAVVNLQVVNPMPMVIQLIGALYFSFALMNWTAKDSVIGGIYARPVSLGNFSHFFSGALLLAKYQLSNLGNIPFLILLVIYTIFTGLFWWLVFKHTGVPMEQSDIK
ncbi:MAG: hypothetical protein U0Z26_15070 [Anaerolineales bacterium]